MDNEAKKIRIELVNTNIDEIENVGEMVKLVGQLADHYRKSYDGVKVEIVEKNSDTIKTKSIVVSGVRAEKEEEKESRLGINTKDEHSWLCKYSKLIGCTKKESNENMQDMLKENLMLTPEEWLEHKKKKIEDFFNVGKNIKK